MKEIPVGEFGQLIAFVDDEDFERLSQFKWSVTDGYALRGIKKPNGQWTTIRMAREVMQAPSGVEVDHINRNRLDNQKRNLRFATRSQNMMNTPVSSRNKLGVKGVCLRPNGLFYASTKFRGKKMSLGYYPTLEQASAVYRDTVRKLHGEFCAV